MIEYLEGLLAGKSPALAVVQVGGAAFGCMISLSTYDDLPAVGTEAKLWTKLQIRDDQPVLYGFATVDERQLFTNLISVNGVGPKLAMTILSGARAESIREVITQGDSVRLKAIRGIGGKTADRIILELQKKLSLEQPVVPGARRDKKADSLRQAIEALTALGFRQSEAEKAVTDAAKSGARGVEDLIKQSLRKG